MIPSDLLAYAFLSVIGLVLVVEGVKWVGRRALVAIFQWAFRRY